MYAFLFFLSLPMPNMSVEYVRGRLLMVCLSDYCPRHNSKMFKLGTGMTWGYPIPKNVKMAWFWG